ncbi:MAG: hypothetical protein NW200_11400 [Hyphomonadaceae bacterium]|nr:hypothetical protein [Hyphomonadaceae bacterium]
MAVTRIHTPDNGLARILGGKDARSMDDLVRDAEERLVQIAPHIDQFVAREIDVILAIGGQREEEVFAECRKVSDAALRVAEVAGAAGATAVGDVARGIRLMIDSLFTGGVWHADALRIHVESLAILTRGAPQSPAEADVIVERLKVLRARIGVPD